MRRNATIAIILFVLLWTGVRFVFAQSNAIDPVPYVYRIDIKGCKFEPQNRRQTGFRVEGTTGIVTTLHGVADCTLIDATADGEREKFTQLTIRQVDITHDVVVLSSPNLDELPAEGLAVSPLSNTEILTASLRIVGYPRGLEAQDIDVIESIRDVESLDDVIPDAEEPAAFIKRKSPDLNIQVLNVQAQLLPGHSGAPLIDSEDRVVAIGNGGLRAGSDGRSWAILWNAADLQSVALEEVQARLAELAEKDIAALSFSSTFPSQVDDATGVKSYTVQIIDAGDSKPIANAEVLLTHSAGYEIGVTDAEGFHTFRLAANDEVDYAESQLQVEAVGYVSYNRDVANVLTRNSPEKLLLSAVEPTVPALSATQVRNSSCEFAFRVLDEESKPIRGARVRVLLGFKVIENITNSDGEYRGELSCDRTNPQVTVIVSAEGYGEIERDYQLSGPISIQLTKTVNRLQPTRESTATPQPTHAFLGESKTDIPDVIARLKEFSRFQNTITARVIFINSSDELRSFWPTVRSYLLDEENGKRYSWTDQQEASKAD
ncbi:MAG: trypsin-like peptidase domain-containing protein, partial [Caldilineaceae bacterium]|nr:trypsin-like peptidase domain-containing protein [Caldilineaceae bacterium]